MPTSTAAGLLEGVRGRAAGSPYVVEVTEKGFDVKLNIVDAQWYALFSKQGLRRTWVYHVKVDEAAGTYAITDDEYTVSWSNGVGGNLIPTLTKSMERQMGTTYEFSTEKVWAWDQSGQFGKVVDYTFNSAEGRALIDTVAQGDGWKKTMSARTKVGVAFAIVGGLGALITVVAVLLSR